jgi:hypothetical protein
MECWYLQLYNTMTILKTMGDPNPVFIGWRSRMLHNTARLTSHSLPAAITLDTKHRNIIEIPQYSLKDRGQHPDDTP